MSLAPARGPPCEVHTYRSRSLGADNDALTCGAQLTSAEREMVAASRNEISRHRPPRSCFGWPRGQEFNCGSGNDEVIFLQKEQGMRAQCTRVGDSAVVRLVEERGPSRRSSTFARSAPLPSAPRPSVNSCHSVPSHSIHHIVPTHFEPLLDHQLPSHRRPPGPRTSFGATERAKHATRATSPHHAPLRLLSSHSQPVFALLVLLDGPILRVVRVVGRHLVGQLVSQQLPRSQQGVDLARVSNTSPSVNLPALLAATARQRARDVLLR